MALFAGESAALVDMASSAAEVMERMLSEALAALSRIGPLCKYAPSGPLNTPLSDRLAELGG